MKLYHGSKTPIKYLESRQANKGNVSVPAEELLNGIYFTPNYGFAVAMAARPQDSATYIDDSEHKITFEKPELFFPEEDIFIYSIDSEKLPEQNLKYVDELQYVVQGLEYVIPEETEIVKARKVLEFYELMNWNEQNEITKEISNQFKLR